MPDSEATPETLYYTGSTTKSFTAAVVSLLIDDTANSSHRLKWTTPISSVIRDDFVLPDEYSTAHVTIEDAASHRTGMPRHDASYGGPGFTMQDVVRSLRYLPLTAEIRTTFQYCNLMFVTLSYMIETLTGEWLGDTLHTRIWEPLSMSSTYFSLQDAKKAVATKNEVMAHGYLWENRTQEYILEEYMDMPEVSGAGAIISNVLDYSKYLRAMIDEAPPISPAGYAALKIPRSFADFGSPLYDAWTEVSTYSLGWEMTNYRGEKAIFHGGGLTGFGTLMLYMPRRKWGVVMMGNTAGTSNMAEQVLSFALMNDLLEVPTEQRIDWRSILDQQIKEGDERLEHGMERLYPDAPKESIPLSLPLEEYTGVYTHPAYRSVNLTIVKPNEGLPLSEKSTKILHADAFDRTWPQELHFQHVSGEYFLIYASRPKSQEYLKISEVMKGEFTLDASGKVAKLGLLLEPMMGEDKIWFEKMT